MPHVEDASKPTDTVYGYVPIEVIEQVITKHGGLDEDAMAAALTPPLPNHKA